MAIAFVDTGYYLALLNRRDALASRALEIDRRRTDISFATSDSVLTRCPRADALVHPRSAGVGATAIVTLVVTAPRAGTFTNCARVGASTADPSAANNVGSSTVQIGGRVDLAITKAASAGTFVRGKPLSFTIVVRNTGPDDVAGAQIRDLLPAATERRRMEMLCGAARTMCGATGMGSIRQTAASLRRQHHLPRHRRRHGERHNGDREPRHGLGSGRRRRHQCIEQCGHCPGAARSRPAQARGHGHAAFGHGRLGCARAVRDRDEECRAPAWPAPS